MTPRPLGAVDQLELFHQHEFTTHAALIGGFHEVDDRTAHRGADVDLQHCPCGARRELFRCTTCGQATSYVSEAR